jgi:Bacterial dnaA protein helix-turn-helix
MSVDTISIRSLEHQEAPALERKGFCKVNQSAAGKRQEGGRAGPFLHTPEAEARGVVPMSPYPTIAAIKAAVCEHFRVSELDMKSHRTGREVARPRQVAMWIARHATLHTIPEIGRYFGRDHTTVLHAIKTVSKLVEDGDETGMAAQMLLNTINNHRPVLRIVA